MERTAHILFKKHLCVNDPWVLLVSSILLLPVKLLPSVLPQEIKTQRETSVLEEEQEDRGFPLQPCGRHWSWFCPRTSCHFREETPALLSLREEGGGFLCSHNLSPCSCVRSDATSQSSDGTRGGLPMQTHTSSRSTLATPRWCATSGLINSHKLWLPLQRGTCDADTKPLSSWSMGHADLTPCLCTFGSEGDTVRHVLSGAEAHRRLPVCTEAGTQQARVTDHQKETRVGKKTPEECVS